MAGAQRRPAGGQPDQPCGSGGLSVKGAGVGRRCSGHRIDDVLNDRAVTLRGSDQPQLQDRPVIHPRIGQGGFGFQWAVRSGQRPLPRSSGRQIDLLTYRVDHIVDVATDRVPGRHRQIDLGVAVPDSDPGQHHGVSGARGH